MGTKCTRSVEGESHAVSGLNVLDEFVAGHADARRRVESLLGMIKQSQWNRFYDIGQTLGRGRVDQVSVGGLHYVYFDVGGGRYRIEALVHYQTQTIRFTWAGTHAEYDRR